MVRVSLFAETFGRTGRKSRYNSAVRIEVVKRLADLMEHGIRTARDRRHRVECVRSLRQPDAQVRALRTCSDGGRYRDHSEAYDQ